MAGNGISLQCHLHLSLFRVFRPGRCQTYDHHHYVPPLIFYCRLRPERSHACVCSADQKWPTMIVRIKSKPTSVVSPPGRHSKFNASISSTLCQQPICSLMIRDAFCSERQQLVMSNCRRDQGYHGTYKAGRFADISHRAFLGDTFSTLKDFSFFSVHIRQGRFKSSMPSCMHNIIICPGSLPKMVGMIHKNAFGTSFTFLSKL